MKSEVLALELLLAIGLAVIPATAKGQQSSGGAASIPPPAPSYVAPPSPPPIQTAPAQPTPIPVTQLATDGQKPDWFQSPVLFLPGRTKGGSGNFRESQTIFEAPLVWAMAGRIGADVTISGPGAPVQLKAGDVLPAVAPRMDGRVDERFTLFCTRNKIIQKSKSYGFLDDLEYGLMRGMRDAQWCLQDSDGDGELDLAVVLNAGAPISQAAAIEPVPYEVRNGETILGGDDRLRVILNRVGKRETTLMLSIRQMGREMTFDTLTSGLYEASKFTNVTNSLDEKSWTSVLGISFGVSQPDQKGNSASIEWLPVANNASYVVIPTELVRN